MGDGAGEAALRARIVQYQRDIMRLTNKEKVTVADRNEIARLLLIRTGLEEALTIISTYSEGTRSRQR